MFIELKFQLFNIQVFQNSEAMSTIRIKIHDPVNLMICKLNLFVYLFIKNQKKYANVPCI